MTPLELMMYKKRAIARIHAQNYRKEHRREFVSKSDWYDWQLEAMQALEPQVMTMAANQTGKTWNEGYHFALDATGDYPDWWEGYRFDHAPNMLAMGVDNDQLKDVCQTELFGPVLEEGNKKQFAGGWIHRDEIGRVEWSQITGLARRVEVIGKYGRSSVALRCYTQSKTGQGSLSFAGRRICRVWCDECPPDDIVGQLIVRTSNGNMGRGGRIGYTMTPELGTTELVTDFMENKSPSQRLVGPITWDDCPHMTEDKKANLLAGIPEHEHDMRSKGIPFFGQGLVFTVPDARIRIESFQPHKIPWLRYIRAIDLGIDHPTAIAWLAHDPEIDRIYLLRTYSERGQSAAEHARVANSYLDFAPVVFPHDVDQREKGSGQTVRKFYHDAGLKNTVDFKNPDGSLFVEPGILDLNERMVTDRFQVVGPQCEDFFREKRLYHRDKGKINPINDDVISAVRYGSQMITRYGVPYGGTRRGRKPRVKKSFN